MTTPLEQEIEQAIREMANGAPDVESGDMSAEDVFLYWRELFERYAAEKIADMTAQRDAACKARDAATEVYREGLAAASQVTRRMELERDAAVRNCALTQSRYDALRFENERKGPGLYGDDVRSALVVLKKDAQDLLRELLWDRACLL